MPSAGMDDHGQMRLERNQLTVKFDGRAWLTLEHKIGLSQPLMIVYAGVLRYLGNVQRIGD